MLKSWAGDLLAVIALIALTCGYFWQLIFTRSYTIMANPDDSIQSYAWYQFLSRSLALHEIPLWDPFVMGGHPFTGEIQSGAFYLPNLLLSGLAAGGRVWTSWIEYYLIFHAFLGTLFAYLLARHLKLQPIAAMVGAIVFMFGGVVVGRMDAQSNIFLGLIWLPLALLLSSYGIEKHSLFLSGCAGFALAASLLAGHIEPPYQIAVALAAFIVLHALNEPSWRRRCIIVLHGVITFVLGGMAAAIQLFPAMEYAPLSLRGVGGSDLIPGNIRLPYPELTRYSVDFGNLLSVVFPRVDLPSDVNPYLGIAVLSLAALGVARWRGLWAGYFLLIGTVSLLTALGAASILHGWEYSLVPLSDRVREAGRRLYLFQFAMAMLSGYGTQVLLSEANSGEILQGVVRFCWVFTAVSLTFATVLTIWSITGQAASTKQIGESLFHTGFVSLVFCLVISALSSGRITPRVSTMLLLALVVWDLFSAGVLVPKLRSDFDGSSNLYPERYYANSSVVSFLTAHAADGRVNILTDRLPPNVGDLTGIRTIFGHGATLLASYDALLSRSWDPNSKFSQLLGVEYYVDDKPKGSRVPLASDGTVNVYAAAEPLPPMWIIHRVTATDNASDAIAKLSSNAFDPRVEAIVPTAPPDGAVILPVPGAKEQVAVTARGLQSMMAEVFLSTPGLVVSNEIFYPGWKAYLDGVAAPIIMTDVSLRGVYVPAGHHLITYIYAPQSFAEGAMLSSLAFIGILLLGVLELSRQVKGRFFWTFFGVLLVLGVAVGLLIIWQRVDPLHEHVSHLERVQEQYLASHRPG